MSLGRFLGKKLLQLSEPEYFAAAGVQGITLQFLAMAMKMSD